MSELGPLSQWSSTALTMSTPTLIELRCHKVTGIGVGGGKKCKNFIKISVEIFVLVAANSCDAFRCMKSTGLVGFGVFVVLSGVGHEL